MELIPVLTFTDTTQMDCTATWVVKATPPNYVEDRPYLTCIILRGRIPSEPLSFQLLASGPRWAAIGTG